MLRFKICNLFFSSSVASCQQAMVIVPAMASSGSKPSGATESSVSGATKSSGSAMERYFHTHTHDKDLRAQYAAENKQKLEVVSVPAKASSASKPSGATEPNVSENKRKLEASGEAVQKAMRGGRKQLRMRQRTTEGSSRWMIGSRRWKGSSMKGSSSRRWKMLIDSFITWYHNNTQS